MVIDEVLVEIIEIHCAISDIYVEKLAILIL